MNVQVSVDAERDLSDGLAFYGKSGTRIGDHFRNSILADLQSFSLLGGGHSKRFGYYCMAAKRFPYAVYYLCDGATVSVVAVLDERRDPTWIQHRLSRE